MGFGDFDALPLAELYGSTIQQVRVCLCVYMRVGVFDAFKTYWLVCMHVWRFSYGIYHRVALQTIFLCNKLPESLLFHRRTAAAATAAGAGVGRVAAGPTAPRGTSAPLPCCTCTPPPRHLQQQQRRSSTTTSST
jgi:hypothetical protein